MKRVDLIKVEHVLGVGDICRSMQPNITEDCLLYDDGVIIGFFIKDMLKYSTKISQLANIADNELRSKNVPKTQMNRTSGEQGTTEKIPQFSTIIGAVPPRPHMKRPYASFCSVHSVPSAKVFIKAMYLLCSEAEELIKKIAPDIYNAQCQLIEENCPKKWRFGKLFTSSISNYNIAAAYHKDNANIKGCVNVIITKRLNAVGGYLSVPDYNAVFDSCDNSMLVYPAWRNLHGVTPIVPTFEAGYRNSLIFYPLKAFKGIE